MTHASTSSPIRESPRWSGGTGRAALIPGDADIIRFGIVLTRPGRIALRNPELRTMKLTRGTRSAAD